MPELWRDIDKVKGTPHMNWSDCPCTQCSIWRIVAALQRAESERDDAIHDRDIYRGQADYQRVRADKAESERDNWNARFDLCLGQLQEEEAIVARIQAWTDSEPWLVPGQSWITYVDGVQARLRGDDA